MPSSDGAKSGIGQLVLIAVVVEAVVVVVVLLLNQLTNTAPGAWQPVLVSASGVVVAGVKAAVDASLRRKSGGDTPPTPGGGGYSPGTPPPHPSPPQRRRGAPLVVALLVLLLVCGGGGLGIAAGAQYAYGWVTGNEPEVVVFQGTVAGGSSRVVLTVTRVAVTDHFTKLDLTAANSGGEQVSLVLGFCQLVGGDGTTLEPDPFRSEWSQDVVPGLTRKGTITFGGQLPPGDATLAFSAVFGPGGGGTLLVRGIPIRAP